MSRIWQERKQANERIVRDFASRSPVMTQLGSRDFGAEWRTIVAFGAKTLVRGRDGRIERAGPVVVGIRYHECFLSEAPHPMEVATILEPSAVFHPNAGYSGAYCLGHPAAGISLELVLHQVWAGLMFNMKTVNTRPGQVINPEAAVYVRTNAHLFPISHRGLFEAGEELRSSHWHAMFDPELHSTEADRFVHRRQGNDR
jgi:hypothetical protein